MYNTQLNAWKYSYKAHGMQCMKFLRVNLQNPSQKLHKNLFDFEKPQILQKSQNLGFKEWNAWKWENRILPNEEKSLKMLEKHLGKRFGVRERDLEGEQVRTDQEKLRK